MGNNFKRQSLQKYFQDFHRIDKYLTEYTEYNPDGDPFCCEENGSRKDFEVKRMKSV